MLLCLASDGDDGYISSSYGGAILARDGSHVTMHNSTVSGGEASKGGGLCIEGSSLDMRNVTIDKCSALGKGGDAVVRKGHANAAPLPNPYNETHANTCRP